MLSHGMIDTHDEINDLYTVLHFICVCVTNLKTLYTSNFKAGTSEIMESSALWYGASISTNGYMDHAVLYLVYIFVPSRYIFKYCLFLFLLHYILKTINYTIFVLIN